MRGCVAQLQHVMIVSARVAPGPISTPESPPDASRGSRARHSSGIAEPPVQWDGSRFCRLPCFREVVRKGVVFREWYKLVARRWRSSRSSLSSPLTQTDADSALLLMQRLAMQLGVGKPGDIEHVVARLIQERDVLSNTLLKQAQQELPPGWRAFMDNVYKVAYYVHQDVRPPNTSPQRTPPPLTVRSRMNATHGAHSRRVARSGAHHVGEAVRGEPCLGSPASTSAQKLFMKDTACAVRAHF